MYVAVTSTLENLEKDFRTIARQAPAKFRGVVREGVKTGNQVAKDLARQSEGSHGKYYHRAFTWEMSSGFSGFGSDIYSGVYGPDAAFPQGGMSFEWGSRNQKPHLDLNKSADLIGPSFAQEVRDAAGSLFWPDS